MFVFLVTRKHKTGTLTACFYLVDTYCLGVKDVTIIPSISQKELEKEIESRKSGETCKMDYVEIHNWIYGSIEYAREAGIEPCKEFTSLAQYILCDDEDESIPIIEYHFGGDNSKPLFIPFDKSQYDKYHPILMKNLGPNGFDYICPINFIDD